jgi:sulfate adenylyltransferase subunit 2
MTTTPLRTSPTTDHLDLLESHALFILREVVAECERPVLLFSGGKDSAVLLHLAVKAFAPQQLPFPVMHIDTGQNFPEVLEFRDATVERVGARLVVAKVQDTIDQGKVVDPGLLGSRNRLQTVTLLDAINDNKFDAAFGGARRDEDKARAKERILSFRDTFGQWDPRQQRPELWQLYQGKVNPGEHVRAFPLSDWTELDVWQYIEREEMALPTIYFAHERDVVMRDGMWLAVGPFVEPRTTSRSSGSRCAFARWATPTAPAPCSPGPTLCAPSSTRSPSPTSLSAARRGRTTSSPRPPWRTANVKAISR